MFTLIDIHAYIPPILGSVFLNITELNSAFQRHELHGVLAEDLDTPQVSVARCI